MQSELPPAGWYPDPQQPERQRWWDGTEWTDTLLQAAPDINDPLWQAHPEDAKALQAAATPRETAHYHYDVPDEIPRSRNFGRTFWTIAAVAVAYTAGMLTAALTR